VATSRKRLVSDATASTRNSGLTPCGLARKRPPLIVIGNYEGDRKAYHSITAAGRKALEKAEAAAKKVAKENAA
jgi:hypothetical protein